jgi:hypothetical protein
LLDQGRSSVASRAEIAKCVYRDPEGLRCAAGLWVRDDDYDELLENMSVIAAVVGEHMPPKFWKEHSSLLHALQGVHDGMPHREKWTFQEIVELKQAAERIATTLGLEWKFG